MAKRISLLRRRSAAGCRSIRSNGGPMPPAGSEHIEKERYLYAKQWPAMAEHCRSLIRFYEGAVQENRQMAALHREVAANANP